MPHTHQKNAVDPNYCAIWLDLAPEAKTVSGCPKAPFTRLLCSAIGSSKETSGRQTSPLDVHAFRLFAVWFLWTKPAASTLQTSPFRKTEAPGWVVGPRAWIIRNRTMRFAEHFCGIHWVFVVKNPTQLFVLLFSGKDPGPLLQIYLMFVCSTKWDVS